MKYISKAKDALKETREFILTSKAIARASGKYIITLPHEYSMVSKQLKALRIISKLKALIIN